MGVKLTPANYIDIYEAAREGASVEDMSKSLGLSLSAFAARINRDPLFATVVRRGRAKHAEDKNKTALTKEDNSSLGTYIYDHLTPEVQEIWDQVDAATNEENGVAKVEALLRNQGVAMRQHLFVHALTQSVFNVSQSLRKLNISRTTFERWTREDAEFGTLIDEILWHKENFFEQALIGRIAAGDTQAIIFAAKTRLRSRGYGEKLDINHTGSITHKNVVDLSELDLDPVTMRTVLNAVRAKQGLPAHKPAIKLPVVVENAPAEILTV